MEGFMFGSIHKNSQCKQFDYNCGGYFHQSNDMVRKFHLNLSDSKLQNAATTTAHIYKLLVRMFEKKQMLRGGIMCNHTYGCAK